MRRCPRIGGREMTNPATGQKAGVVLGQHPARLHGFGPAAYPVMLAFRRQGRSPI
jgi:hypothetical protein